MPNPLFYGTVRKSPECFILNLTLSLLFIGVASGVRLHPHLEDEEWYLILSFGKWWIPHLRIVHCPKGGKHNLHNNTDKPMLVLSIKRA